MKSEIGYKVDWKPANVCDDKNCPYHSDVSIRGKMFEGTVVSDLMSGTVKVMWERLDKIKKYSRYIKKKSVVAAHNPKCINAKKGDRVIIGETRPLSKTKHFAIMKVLNE